MTTRISNTVLELVNDKLDQYKEILDENVILYKHLKDNINNNPNCINMELVSRLDDIQEDIVTMGVNCRLVLNSIINQSALTMSDREADRTIRNNQIKQLLPVLFLLSQMN
jgi:predicted metallo-beta-lactamase superfamily hydrolase